MKIIVFLSTVLLSFLGFSQNLNYHISGKITNSDTKKMEAGVNVSLVNNGKVVVSAVTSSNGKYDLKAEVPYNGSYQVVYSKPGFVTKKVAISTAKVNIEDFPDGAEPPIPVLDMDLFSEKPNVDFSFLNNEPVASFFWDEAKFTMNFDRDASAKTKKKIEDALASAGNKAAEDEAKYQAAVKAGEGLYNQKKYEEALAKYEEASSIKPKEPIPLAKIAELDKLIKDQKSQALANAQLETEYKNLIAAADNLRDQKKYTESLAKYNEALKKKEDTYPKAEIAKLNKLIEDQKAASAKDTQFEVLKKEGMTLATAKKYTEAKIKLQQALDIKQDAVITLKIKEIDDLIKAEQAKSSSEENYKRLLSEAATLEASKNYDGAIAKYKEALVIKPTEIVPKSKISELEKLKKEAAGQSQADAQKAALYNTHMSNGAKNIASKNYKQALTDFQNAISVKPGDSAAQGKISEVQQILDDLQNSSNKDAEVKKNFDKQMVEALKLFNQKNYLAAKAAYEKALTIKSDDATAIKQVNECQRLLDKERGEDVKKEYDKIINIADKKFNEKDYLKAKEYYERALTFKASDPYPKAKLIEIGKLLNPTPQVAKVVTSTEPEKLKDLGIPYDKSEEQALADLKAAQIIREDQNNKTIKEGIKIVNEHDKNLSDQKQQEQLETTEAIVELEKSMDDNASNEGVKHQAIIEKNKKVEKEILDFNVEANTLEHSDHLNIQEKMDIVQIENDESFTESLNQYLDKGDEMKKQNSSLDDEKIEETKKYDNVIQESITVIREVEKGLDETKLDNKEKRLAAEERIETVVDKTIQIDHDLRENEVNQNLDTKGKITASENDMNTNFEIDVENAKETLNDLEEMKHDVREIEDASSEKDVNDGAETTQQMVNLKKRLDEEKLSNENKLQMATEVLKDATKNLNDQMVEDYNKEMTKYLASQNSINEKTKVVGDDESNSTEKLIVNNGLLKDMTTSLQDKNVEIEAEQVDKHQGAQQALNEKRNEITDEKPVIANALGSKYPEGVSQESFTQNDENGLMKAIITRRIVVIQGKGDVYVKTQTLGNITYTKNGDPATERIWQKETQGPHLKKNY